MTHKIDAMIAELDIDKLRSVVHTGEIEPRPYQWLVYEKTAEVIRKFGKYPKPSFVTASVGAGKTIMIAMIARRFQDMGWEGLVIARQGEIIEQDAEELWNLSVKNSLFSASLGRKSTAYPLIAGTEGTIINGLFDKKDDSGNILSKGALSDFCPRYILIDECHQMNWEDVVSESPETQYGVIMTELNRRCKAKYGHDVIVIGYTGSPFRGTDSIKGAYWKHEIVNIDTKYLVDIGFLVPTIFGLHDIDDLHYDLSAFEASGSDGTQDFTAEQLKQMQKEILEQGTLTQKIMLKVMELTKNRNGVLITCAGKKHCQEAAKYLPEGSYAIVTEDMGQKARRKALKDAYTGKIKYVFQIGCLTTGVNIPLWDTSVILRKIMSLTLLVQLLGRGMRLLKKEQIDAGYHKEDHLVLDFSGTMFELGKLYEDPILEEAEAQRSKRSGEQVPCPKCGTMNSPYARRCIGKDALSPDGRCEEFFSYIRCGFDKHGIRIFDDGCGTKNDPTARYCRHCDHVLRDPNAALNERAYTDNEWTEVKDFKIELTKDEKGVVYRYFIMKENGKEGWANEVFYPFGRQEKYLKNQFKIKGLLNHVSDRNLIDNLMNCHNAKAFMAFTGLIRAPKRITHRFNDKGRDIIHRKDFTGE
ncbi:DEAD/DEAH box helicase [Salmonella enterica]|uniref:Putative ATP-dependent helicase n=1 Tax=Salmonella phage vB_Se_STGO-35-1 TaxID=2749381 RepID=A0A889IPX4_9CAUD|nr:DEAD/DEAH box helicase family protein [Salmonella enterica]YP_010054092.1 DEAD/DEAH box helicase family protein [Salmonella phage vB_Se_STGO-35-1]QRD99807.1 putative ATP-dependent helicase [Salmonella phage vB_Se_STGO-35-1]